MFQFTKKRKKAFIKIAILIGILLKLTIVYYIYIHHHSNISITDNKKHLLYIDRDDSFEDILEKLESENVIKNIRSFKRLAIHSDYPEHIRTGCYLLKNGMSNKDLVNMLKGGNQTPVNLTFNNIRTREILAQRLSSQLMIDSIEIVRAINDKEIQSAYEFDDKTILCMFIPNTYQVYWNISTDELIKRMDNEYKRFWNEERRQKASQTGLTPIEVSILASIVDEETNVNAEKPTVAGLYINRLRKGMLLQADPTVKFAVQDFTLRRVLNKHLEKDSPYNTYMYAGLPPGPIRIPSIVGIDAVLNYEKHNYLYMTAKEDFSGRHNFATTHSEHIKNASRYRNALNKLKIYQ